MREVVGNKDCTLCTLSANCSRVCRVSKVNPEGRTLMIVGDHGYREDTDENFLNNYVLNGVLQDVLEVPEDIIYRAYAVKCTDNEGLKPSDADIKICSEAYLKKEIEEVQPKCILVMGETSLKAVLALSGISKYRGKYLEYCSESSDFKCTVIPTFSPVFVANIKHEGSKNVLRHFAEDVQKAHHVAVDYVPKVDEDFTKVILADTLDKVDDVVSYVKQVGKCTFDFESNHLDWWKDDFYVTGLALTFQHGSGYFIPISHKEPVFDGKGKFSSYLEPIYNDDQRSYIISKVREIFYDPDIVKVAQNIKFDLNVASTLGIELRGRLLDTMTMFHCIDGSEASFGLDYITSKYFPQLSGYKAVIDKYGYDKVPLDILAKYAVTDSDVTARIATYFENLLIKEDRQYRHYRNLCLPLTKELFKAENRGFTVDEEYLDESIAYVEDLLIKKEAKLRENKRVIRFEATERKIKNDTVLAQYEEKKKALEDSSGKHARHIQNYTDKINAIKTGQVDHYTGLVLNSPQQMARLLYEDYGFGFKRPKDEYGRTMSGTGKDTVSLLEDDSGFISEYLAYRSLSKLLSTYLVGLKKCISSSGRVHTSYSQLVLTGRLASSNPNLQNIPNVAKLDDPDLVEAVKRVKKCFIPYEKGEILTSDDLSQAELRTIASYAQDTTMLSYYRKGYDLHVMTAINAMKITMDEFNALSEKQQKESRKKAKPVNFGYIYGMGWKGMKTYARNNYGVSFTDEESRHNRDAYFRLYSKLLDYHAKYINKARKYGHVWTLFGRKVTIAGINSDNDTIRGNAERTAINAPIQGTSGEWTEFAIVLCGFRLNPKAKFMNTVHDSIIKSVPPELVEEVKEITRLTIEELPVEKYFGKSLEGVTMKTDFEMSDKSWGDLS